MTPNHLTRARVLALVLTCSLVLLFPTRTFAWGDKGHQIIGALAWLKLSDDAKQYVNELLPEAASDPNGPLAAVGPWADRRGLANPEERKWHFVMIKLWDAAYNSERDCADGNCIVVKLEDKKNILQFNSDRRTRAEALKYVIHLVGDIHQPLHCIDNNDNAGNSLLVKFMGERTDLHKVWDVDMIEASKLSVGEYAKKLSSLEVTKGYWIDHWTNDSHEIATRYVYAIPKDGELGRDYYRRNLPILDRQLALAAEKLRGILEEVLTASPRSRRRRR